MFKVEFLRFIKIPMNMFFAFLLPIALMILFAEFLDESVFKVNFVPLVLLTTVATTIMPISINVCMDKVSKRTKHYVIIPGAMSRYIGSLFLTNLIIAELTSLVLVLIGIFGYHVEVPTPNILMLIFAPPLSFILGFSIAIILAKYSKSLTVVLPLAMVTLFIVIFLSGMTIPLQFFAKDYFYYIQI
jgi:ABC-2 type transport system permease protein